MARTVTNWEVSMNQSTRRALGVAGLALMVTASAVWAQSSPPVRIRGQIEKVDGGMLTIKARDGKEMSVRLGANAGVMARGRAKPEDIKPNSYLGVTALPQPDGSQKAVAIHIFLEAQRGTGEGFRPWDKEPGSTMTNAAVSSTVASVNGQEVVVKYKD